MWTVLIVGLGILFCGIWLIFSEAFQKKQKVKDTIASFVMIVGVVVAMAGSFVSVYVSESKIPENYSEPPGKAHDVSRGMKGRDSRSR